MVFVDLGPMFELLGGGYRPDLCDRRRPGQDPAPGLRSRRPGMPAATISRRTATPSPAPTCTSSPSSAARAQGYGYAQLACRPPHRQLPARDRPGRARRELSSSRQPGLPLSGPDRDGNPRTWIYEVHFVDRERGYGGFFEQWLELDDPGPRAVFLSPIRSIRTTSAGRGPYPKQVQVTNSPAPGLCHCWRNDKRRTPRGLTRVSSFRAGAFRG